MSLDGSGLMVGGSSIWIPTMNEASMGGGFIASPCKDCPKRFMDKDKCMGTDGCRFDTTREPVYAPKQDVAITTYSKKPYPCAWPGCTNMIHRGKYCTCDPEKHSSVVSRRKNTLGWPESRWYEPVGHPHSRSNSGPKKGRKK